MQKVPHFALVNNLQKMQKFIEASRRAEKNPFVSIDIHGRDVVSFCAAYGGFETLKYLLEARASTETKDLLVSDSRDEGKSSPLYYLLQRERFQILKQITPAGHKYKVEDKKTEQLLRDHVRVHNSAFFEKALNYIEFPSLEVFVDLGTTFPVLFNSFASR
jgi:hypothetical protein